MLYHVITDQYRYTAELYDVLPRDAMRKHGLCCRPVSVRLSRLCIVSRWLKISSSFFLDLVAP